MPYIIEEEGKEPQICKQINDISEKYKINTNKLYYQFSRLKKKKFEVRNLTIYKR